MSNERGEKDSQITQRLVWRVQIKDYTYGDDLLNLIKR